MFYDQFVKMCTLKKVTPNKALVDCEISRTSVAKWKKGATPNGSNIQKLAEYFGVSAGYLLGTEIEKAPTSESERIDRNAMVAFFEGADVPDDEMDELWEDAKDYIAYKINQKRKRNK